MVAVEGSSRVVLGIHHQGKDGHFRACGPFGSIREQGAAELPALEGLVNRQSSGTRHRNGRTARQLLGQCLG